MAILGYKALPLERLFLSLHILPESFDWRTASGGGEVAGVQRWAPRAASAGNSLRSIRLLTPLRWLTSEETESVGEYSTSNCPSPTTSTVVRLAVQLQQLKTHFLCNAQTDPVHPLQCSAA